MIMTRKEILFESEDEAEINKKESKIGIYEQTNKKKVVNDVVLNPVALGLPVFIFCCLRAVHPQCLTAENLSTWLYAVLE